MSAQTVNVQLWTSSAGEEESNCPTAQAATTISSATDGREDGGVVDIAEGVEYRLAPLLAVIGVDDPWTAGRTQATAVVVGHTHVYVSEDGAVSLHVVVGQIVTGPGRGPGSGSGRWRSVDTADARFLDEVLHGLRSQWERNGHRLPESDRARATTAAKALSENSRDAVAHVREARYEVERHFGLHLRRESHEDMELVLADVVVLSTIVGRARDVSRSCVRSGLQYWINDPAMYHAQRRLLDPSLPAREGREDAEADPTFPVYDAAVRQCRALERELSEELDAHRSVLAAGSAIAVTRDAQAQEKFTILATVSAVALGLPALVLALYGASAFLPFDRSLAFGSFRLLYPVLAAGIMAACLAASLPGKGKRRWRFVGTLAGVVILFVLLAFAGRYGPPESGPPTPTISGTPTPTAAP